MSLISWAYGLMGGGAGQRRPGVQSGESAAYPGRSPAAVNQNTALCLSAVWACVRLISESVGSMPLRFYEESASGVRKYLPDYFLARLFNGKVNAWQTRNEFFETLISQLVLLGNAYALKQRGTSGELIGLLPMMSEQMKVSLADDSSMLRLYQYQNGTNVRSYSEDKIWHNKLFGNGVMGLSPLSYARNSIGIGLATEARVGKIMANGAKPAGVLTTGNEKLSPDQRARIKENFADIAKGDEDTLFVLEAGFDYKQISMSPKDIELISSRRFQIEDIARFFGVPSVLINDTSASTTWGSGIEQIVQGFYKLNLRPYLERLESSINYNLVPEKDRGRIKAEFDFDALLRGDMAAIIKMLKEAVTGGLKTPNEARAYLGDAKLAGGDDIYLQAQMVPLAILSTGAALSKQPASEQNNEPKKPA